MYEPTVVSTVVLGVVLGLLMALARLFLSLGKKNMLLEPKTPKVWSEPLPEDSFPEEAICTTQPSVDEFESLMIKELEKFGSRFKR